MPFAYNGDRAIFFKVEGTGEPLVLLHGFLNDHEIWYDLSYVRSLKEHFMLIMIDLRGYGKSYKSHHPDDYFIIHRVRDVTAVMDHLKLFKADIMGYSMGGRIAFGFGKYAPERVRTLIIGGMSPYGRMGSGLDKRIEMLKNDMKETVDDYERRYGPLPDKVRERIMKNDPEALIADTIDTRDWRGVEERLATMRFPILFYCGENDYFYEESLKAKDLMWDVTWVSIPDANHQEAYVKKRLIVSQIIEFLNNRPFYS